ncbi:hypothetical protein H6503_05625 [Candidatus Woesearchaeota archaeon]|nr:hypothetical protein [Candidatus Woesearchaeota archaeon]
MRDLEKLLSDATRIVDKKEKAQEKQEARKETVDNTISRISETKDKIVDTGYQILKKAVYITAGATLFVIVGITVGTYGSKLYNSAREYFFPTEKKADTNTIIQALSQLNNTNINYEAQNSSNLPETNNVIYLPNKKVINDEFTLVFPPVPESYYQNTNSVGNSKDDSVVGWLRKLNSKIVSQ